MYGNRKGKVVEVDICEMYYLSMVKDVLNNSPTTRITCEMFTESCDIEGSHGRWTNSWDLHAVVM
jgi:hypothetical protein